MKNPELLRKKNGLDLNWIFLCLSLVVLGGRGEDFFGETGGAEDGMPWVPTAARNGLFSEPTKKIPGPEKNFTGVRVRDDSIRLVYHHGQTVAVVEVASDREMFNCELLEVRTEKDKAVALNSLKPVVPVQMKIRFSSMMELMAECQKLDPPFNLDIKFVNNSRRGNNQGRIGRFTSVLSLIFPGTKWCGTGDIAGSYYDLGMEKDVDKCCRTHDFCPIKVAGFKTQYNITNYSIYTKSHCDCDEVFYNCLKSVGSSNSNLIGSFYFNLARVPCVENVPSADPDKTKLTFASKNKRF